MRKDIHPDNYRFCIFKDMSTDFAILTKSCIETNETIKWEDGNEYPLVKMEISHFFTWARIRPPGVSKNVWRRL